MQMQEFSFVVFCGETGLNHMSENDLPEILLYGKNRKRAGQLRFATYFFYEFQSKREKS